DLIAAELAKPLGDKGRGAAFLVSQFRMLVDVAAPGLDFGLQVGDAVDDGHGKLGSESRIKALSNILGAASPIVPKDIDKDGTARLSRLNPPEWNPKWPRGSREISTTSSSAPAPPAVSSPTACRPIRDIAS